MSGASFVGWRTDPAALVAALTGPDTLARYQRELAIEHAISVEAALADHQRRMHQLAAHALAEGFDILARRDAAAADVLLTDLLAVATWHRWELPIHPVAVATTIPADLPSGLLGTGAAAAGATAWLLDGATVVLCRGHQPDAAVRSDGHPRS